MAKIQQKIVIYTDFSSVGQKSIEWGIFLAKKFEKNILLIHVIDNNSKNYFKNEDVFDAATKMLTVLCKEIEEKENILIEHYVEEGCTCKIINSTAEKNDAFLVILGSHSRNDLQFLSAVEIGKIIRKSRIPYFIVQKNSPKPNNNHSIFLPIDLRKENKEKTGWVSYFAKNIKTNIKIISTINNDNTINNNIIFCSKFFNELNLNYEKIIINCSFFSNIEYESVKFSINNDALCVVILTTKEENFINKIFGFREDKIISNKFGMPILCINPKKDLYIPCI